MQEANIASYRVLKELAISLARGFKNVSIPRCCTGTRKQGIPFENTHRNYLLSLIYSLAFLVWDVVLPWGAQPNRKSQRNCKLIVNTAGRCSSVKMSKSCDFAKQNKLLWWNREVRWPVLLDFAHTRPVSQEMTAFTANMKEAWSFSQ